MSRETTTAAAAPVFVMEAAVRQKTNDNSMGAERTIALERTTERMYNACKKKKDKRQKYDRVQRCVIHGRWNC
jgi:hypothetical protein